MDDKINEFGEMRDALASIADELKRCEMSNTISVVTSTTFNVKKTKFNESYKSKFKSKRQIIAKLRKDLKAACLVAETLELGRKNKITALTSQLAYARGECVDLLKRYINNIDIIDNLHKQNKSLYEKFEDLANFIHLAYDELKKIQNEITDEPTTEAQLMKLIESCGQYYADYCNETEKSTQIKQRNRFLKSKITILENNIAAIKEQLKGLEYRYLRLQVKNNQIRIQNVKSKCLNLKTYSAVEMKQSKVKEEHESSDEILHQDSGDSSDEKAKCFNLTTHLNIVKQLLSDQDALLKDLTLISKEIFIV